MIIRFPFVVLSLTALFGGIIYILHLFGLVTSANEVYARFTALGIFIASFAILGMQKARNRHFSWNDFYKNNTLIIISLSTLLTSLFLPNEVRFYAVGFFAVAGAMHFSYARKFYLPPKFYYAILAYALLLFFGTIGTPKGFRFPDKILSFYILPLVFCLFRLPQKTLLRIGALFFKMGIVFLALSLLYWWFNFLHIDADFSTWIGGKTSYTAQMLGWERQAQIYGKAVGWAAGWENIAWHSAYYFVTSWSYLFHPSFVSLVLLGGLIIGFYLYYKKDVVQTITKYELLLYAGFCFLVETLMQSRIGLVYFLFIMAATGLYYLKLKTKYFKVGLAVYMLLGVASLHVMNDKVSGFVHDDIRDAYRRIAVSYIQKHFWWGSGYNQQILALEGEAESLKDNLPTVIYPHNLHPISYVHNQFLGNMVQYGIWGLLLLLLLLGTTMCYAVKNRSYLLQMFVGFMLLFMMIEEPLYILVGIIPTLTFLIFFAAINESEKEITHA